MTECTHFATDSCKEITEKLTIVLGKYTVNKTNNNYNYNCIDCLSSSFLHVCLTCFMTFCFKNKHFKSHHEKAKHNFFYCLEKKVLFCFTCNQYVYVKSISNLCNYVFVAEDKEMLNQTSKKYDNNKRNRNFAYLNNYYTDKDLKLSCKINHEYTNTQNLINLEDSLTTQINERSYKKMPCTIHKGATNLGNTCYINSLLQIFLSINLFKQKVLQVEHTTHCPCLVCILQHSIEDLYSHSTSLIFSNFVYYLSKKESCFKGSIQYDVHELFIKVCNFLHNDDACRLKKCIAHDLFYGVNIVRMECCKCKKITESNDVFYNLIFEMKQKSIQKMINEYYKSEEIEEKKFCDGCKMMTNYVKTIRLINEPKVLVLSLKRFEIKNNKTIKITDFVHNNLTINIKDNAYKLHGYIQHIGNMNDGHYVSYINSDNGFYKYDDDKIEEITCNEMVENESYLIFYIENAV